MSDLPELHSRLISLMARLEEEEVYRTVRELLQKGVSSEEIQADMNQGLNQVGVIFESGEYFIADLMFAGMIYRSVLDLVTPPQKSTCSVKKARVMIGVVKNDIHDIGKDIIVCLLAADNYDVIDLGIDVKPSAFVDAIQKYHPQILLLSGMMHFARESMRQTVEAIEKAGLREQIYILLGGGCIDSSTLPYVKADAAATDPSETLKKCNDFLERRT